jgi:hypothetical protein
MSVSRRFGLAVPGGRQSLSAAELRLRADGGAVPHG